MTKIPTYFHECDRKMMAYLATLCLKKCCPRNDYDCRNSKFAFARHPSFNSLRVAPLLRLICPPCPPPPPPPKVVTVNQTIAFWTSECCQFNHCRVILIKSQSLKRFLKNTGHCWCKFGILNLCHLKRISLHSGSWIRILSFLGPSQAITALHDRICWLCLHHPWMP